MDKYKRYMGVMIFIVSVVLMIFVLISIITPRYHSYTDLKAQVAQVSQTLEQKRTAKANKQAKINKLKQSIITTQKKLYSPVEDKLENDTLFFTLYSDVIEMVHSNTVKIKSIDYQYNPEGDAFVAQGPVYFVCDVNMEIVSNYTNLGKLIQDIYQYPYYIRINNIEVIPYPKDKKILLSTISLRLYAHTSPQELIGNNSATDSEILDGAASPIPAE